MKRLIRVSVSVCARFMYGSQCMILLIPSPSYLQMLLLFYTHIPIY